MAARRALKAVLVDLSGTLHIEDAAVPGAQEALKRQAILHVQLTNMFVSAILPRQIISRMDGLKMAFHRFTADTGTALGLAGKCMHCCIFQTLFSKPFVRFGLLVCLFLFMCVFFLSNINLGMKARNSKMWNK